MSMCNQYKSIHCLDKQIGFNTAPVAQYCSVARERVKKYRNHTINTYMYMHI